MIQTCCSNSGFGTSIFEDCVFSSYKKSLISIKNFKNHQNRTERYISGPAKRCQTLIGQKNNVFQDLASKNTNMDQQWPKLPLCVHLWLNHPLQRAALFNRSPNRTMRSVAITARAAQNPKFVFAVSLIVQPDCLKGCVRRPNTKRPDESTQHTH